MKKIIVFISILSLGFPLLTYASSIGGAETQGKGKFAIGLDGDYVFSRDIKAKTYVDNLRVNAIGPGGADVIFSPRTNADSPEMKNMYRAMVKASYGIIDNLDVYVKLGTSNGQIRESNSGRGVVTIIGAGFDPINIVNANTKYRADNVFSWAAGLKGKYDVNWLGGFILGCDMQYLRHENDYRASQSMVIDINAGPTLAFSKRWDGTLTIQEWQAAPYIGKKLGNFTPYVGAKYSDIRIKDKPHSDLNEVTVEPFIGNVTALSSQSYKKEYKSRRNIGPFVGLDYKLGDNWKINLEGRFIDETAASLDLMYKF